MRERGTAKERRSEEGDVELAGVSRTRNFFMTPGELGIRGGGS